MSIIMAPKELGHTLFSLSAVDCQQTESRSERDGLLRRVSDEQGVELSFDVPWKDFVTFATKPHSSRYLIASTIRKSGEVNLHRLDRESRKEFDVAKSAEIQNWLRYDAVTAALRSQYHHRDIMKMRWALRYKESVTPKALLVIIGYQDPRVGSEARTEAPVASRRGRGLYFHGHSSQPVLHGERRSQERLSSGDVRRRTTW